LPWCIEAVLLARGAQRPIEFQTLVESLPWCIEAVLLARGAQRPVLGFPLFCYLYVGVCKSKSL
jgi:hypothetical protein